VISGARRIGWFTVFRSRRMAVVFLLGFSSGLRLYLTSQTLQAWLTDRVTLSKISAMSLVGLAYTFKVRMGAAARSLPAAAAGPAARLGAGVSDRLAVAIRGDEPVRSERDLAAMCGRGRGRGVSASQEW